MLGAVEMWERDLSAAVDRIRSDSGGHILAIALQVDRRQVDRKRREGQTGLVHHNITQVPSCVW